MTTIRSSPRLTILLEGTDWRSHWHRTVSDAESRNRSIRPLRFRRFVSGTVCECIVESKSREGGSRLPCLIEEGHDQVIVEMMIDLQCPNTCKVESSESRRPG